MLTKCFICRKRFNIKPSHKKRRNFCVWDCYDKYTKKYQTKKQKLCKQCRKNRVKQKRDTYCSDNCRLLGQKGEVIYSWKGDKAGLSALHQWVVRRKGKPSRCEHCKNTKAKVFDWANKSHKYKRDLNDFIRLCRKCHRKYDGLVPPATLGFTVKGIKRSEKERKRISDFSKTRERNENGTFKSHHLVKRKRIER